MFNKIIKIEKKKFYRKKLLRDLLWKKGKKTVFKEREIYLKKT